MCTLGQRLHTKRELLPGRLSGGSRDLRRGEERVVIASDCTPERNSYLAGWMVAAGCSEGVKSELPLLARRASTWLRRAST